MAFDDLNFASGADTFTNLYTKYNATMDALKAGTLSFVLTGNGAGSAPTYQSIWSDFVIVGNGGSAPAYATNFTTSATTSAHIRFRKSVITDSIQITGRVKRIVSALTAGSGDTVFTLPSGYIPTRPQVGTARANSGGTIILLTVIIDSSTGDVTVFNNTNTATSIAINDFIDITINFPIS